TSTRGPASVTFCLRTSALSLHFVLAPEWRVRVAGFTRSMHWQQEAATHETWSGCAIGVARRDEFQGRSGMFRLLRQRALRWQLLLAAMEFLLLVSCVYCAIGLRYWGDPATQIQFGHALRLRALLVALMVVLGMVALGLYQNHLRANWRGLFTRQAVGFVLGGSALLVLYYVIPPTYIGRGVLGIALVVGFVAVAAFRVVFLRLIDANLFKRLVLFIVDVARAEHIAQRMRRRSDCRGFRIIAYVPMHGEAVQVPASRLVRPHRSLYALAHRMQVDEIVVGP